MLKWKCYIKKRGDFLSAPTIINVFASCTSEALQKAANRCDSEYECCGVAHDTDQTKLSNLRKRIDELTERSKQYRRAGDYKNAERVESQAKSVGRELAKERTLKLTF